MTPYDARAVISPCSLDTTNHTPHALSGASNEAALLRTVARVVEERETLLGACAGHLLDLSARHARAAARMSAQGRRRSRAGGNTLLPA